MDHSHSPRQSPLQDGSTFNRMCLQQFLLSFRTKKISYFTMARLRKETPHCSFSNFSAKVNIFAFIRISFRVSLQPHFYMSLHFLLNELLLLVPISIHKIKSTLTEAVNCSHERIDHSDVEFHTLFAEIFTFAEKCQNEPCDINLQLISQACSRLRPHT